MARGGEGTPSPSLKSTLAYTKSTLTKAMSASKVGATILADNGSTVLNSFLSTLLTAVLVFAVSVFMYGTFYYAYMPLEINNLPVNLQFQPCSGQTTARCSYPTATVLLNRRQQLLQGQLYTIHLTLIVPDSPVMEDLGMFMSCINITSSAEEPIAESCKSAVSEFRSPLLRTLETIVYSPALLTGFSRQKQTLNIHYFSEFQPDPHTPAHKIQLEFQSNHLQVSAAHLHLQASLTGLRHLMYRHPWVSSVLGVGTNILVLSTIIAVSWARFNQAEEEEDTDDNKEKSDKVFDETEGNSANFVEAVETKESISVAPAASVPTSTAVDQPPIVARLKSALLHAILRQFLLALKVVLLLVLVTGSYEAYRLGTEDPYIVMEASKEDLLFFAVYLKEKFLIAVEIYQTLSKSS